jgi:hypothetical protein
VTTFLNELWVETASIVAVHTTANIHEIMLAAMKLVTRPEYRQRATFKEHQRCVPDCDTKTKQQFNELRCVSVSVCVCVCGVSALLNNHLSQSPLTGMRSML